MRRTLVLALGLLLAPAALAAQVEVGVDTGFSYTDQDGEPDALVGLSLPTADVRVGFSAGPQILIDTRISADWLKSGDDSGSTIFLAPGVNYLINDQFYVRGEAGLLRLSQDLTGPSAFSGSGTQYLFGGAVGMRRPLGMGGALLRLEGGVAKGLENLDADIPFASTLIIHASVGVSAVIN